MGQQEVYNFLKRYRNRWFTSREIANGLSASQGSVTTCLKKLRESSTVEFEYRKKISSNRKNAYIYMFKR